MHRITQESSTDIEEEFKNGKIDPTGRKEADDFPSLSCYEYAADQFLSNLDEFQQKVYHAKRLTRMSKDSSFEEKLENSVRRLV